MYNTITYSNAIFVHYKILLSIVFTIYMSIYLECAVILNS